MSFFANFSLFPGDCFSKLLFFGAKDSENREKTGTCSRFSEAHHYSGNNQRLAGKKISTDYYSIMPHLKMRWLNLRILSLYSRIGVGLTFTESSGEGQSESARQWAFQVSPIGVEIGGKVAAYAEAGIGTTGSLVAGLRFRF